MEAIKNTIRVMIIKEDHKKFYWRIINGRKYGLDLYRMNGLLKTKPAAIKHWRRFAKLNDIKFYRFVRTIRGYN